MKKVNIKNLKIIKKSFLLVFYIACCGVIFFTNSSSAYAISSKARELQIKGARDYDPEEVCATVSPGSGGANLENSKLYMLGDSITVGAKDQLSEGFSSSKIEAYINGSVSRSIKRPGTTNGFKTSGLQAVEGQQDRSFLQDPETKTVIVALGTNADGSGSASDYVENMLNLVEKIRAINYSVNIYVVNIFSPAISNKASLNNALQNLASDSDLSVIDTDSAGISTSDNIHPDQAGVKTYVKKVVESVTSNNLVNSQTSSPSGNCQCTSTTTQDTADSSDPKLSGVDTKKINDLKSAYQAAETETGVPWQLLAAVHFRESSNDPSRDLQAGNPFGGGGSQASTSYGTYGRPGTIEESIVIAAKELINKASGGVVKKPITGPNPDSEAVKDALFGYNGRASVYARQAEALGFSATTQPYEGSPYVMNNFDEKHKNMGIITRDFGGLDGTDARPGAYTVYVGLGGGTGGSQTCLENISSDGSKQALIETIKKYTQPEYHSPVYKTKTPEYAAAIEKAVTNGEYVGGAEGSPGIDCGGYITRIMRDSGYDPDYNKSNGNVPFQKQYLDQQVAIGKYEKISGVTSNTSKLRFGDIAISDSHTYMYIGDAIPEFKGNSVSASVAPPERAPMASNVYNLSGFSWYRKVD